ncbi:extracellular solute-binding protein [Chloroflexus sp.]|uniref:sugar ABC transporter substrate-binding protein n=1 Tax=Chloroflexus sp. TaxID=1904827 RepID=UPI00298EF23C|nr:extracellular solute-binding protein [Chloroflexus sp.]MCS6889072.1 extracellular solute-binding protein [Chloroflexus sp.]MDW8405312.1 extracellular solute-binding protein [Chloroflexus sp.]
MRRQFLFRRLLLLWLLVWTSCAAPPTSAPPDRSDRLTLRLWHAWPATEGRVLQALVDQFNQTYPQWQISVQARPAVSLPMDLATAVSEGGGPHLAIVQSHTLGMLVSAGTLRPLDDIISASELNSLIPAAVGAARVTVAEQPALFGLPISFDTLALYYNRANVLQPPATFEELLSTGRALTDRDRTPPVWGLAYNLSLDRTIGYLYAFGGRVFDENGAVVLGSSGRAGAERWLAWLSELYRDEQVLATLDGVVVDRVLQAREAIMTIDWAHAQAEYRAIWNDQLGVTPLPGISGADYSPQPYVQADVIVMNARLSSQAEQAAAQAFMRFMIEVNSQRTLLAAGRQPTQLALQLSDTDLDDQVQLGAARAFRAQAQQGLPMPAERLANEVVWATLADMQLSAVRGLLTPEQAVTIADEILRSRFAPP